MVKIFKIEILELSKDKNSSEVLKEWFVNEGDDNILNTINDIIQSLEKDQAVEVSRIN